MKKRIVNKEEKQVKKTLKNKKGITLIALVITIIVLLILAGVTISTLTGPNGILTRANEAKEQTEIATVKERAQTDILGVQAQNEGKISKGQFVEILKKYFNGVPTAENLPEDLSTLTLKTNDEYGGHDIKISEIYNGNFSDTVEEKTTVEDLALGDKVYYIDKNNVQRECIVLYDASSPYGVQVITADVVGDEITLGGSNDSYNNALKTLYDEAQKYLNTTYASGARCVGSNPADPDWDTTTNEAGYYTKEIAEEQNEYYEYMESYYGTLKNDDSQYQTDWKQMETIININIKAASTDYWLASRSNTVNSSASLFYIKRINYRGEMTAQGVGGTGTPYVRIENDSYGFRPVFTLKSGIKLTAGDGVDTPYTLAQ